MPDTAGAVDRVLAGGGDYGELDREVAGVNVQLSVGIEAEAVRLACGICERPGFTPSAG